VMVQKYISDIKFGDKRVILMHGEPLPYAISRLAKSGETRANLAAGGSCIPAELTERDKWICQQISPVLKQKRLSLVGIDIIGDYLTEINVTSPTCLRDINNAFNINSAAYFFDGLKL
jgi:glutathione synthase